MSGLVVFRVVHGRALLRMDVGVGQWDYGERFGPITNFVIRSVYTVAYCSVGWL